MPSLKLLRNAEDNWGWFKPSHALDLLAMNRVYVILYLIKTASETLYFLQCFSGHK